MYLHTFFHSCRNNNLDHCPLKQKTHPQKIFFKYQGTKALFDGNFLTTSQGDCVKKF